MTPPPEDALSAGVRELIAEGAGSDPGALRLSTIPGGASRETFLAESDGGRWVLRRDPVGAQDSFAPLETEFRVVQAAAAAGVPVARGLAFEPAGGRLESAGFVMDHVEGTSVAPRVLRREELEAARSALPAQLGEALARIHSIDARAIDGVAASDGDPRSRRLRALGGRRSTRSASRCRQSRPGSAGCVSTRRPRRRGSASSTATSGSGT